MRPVQRSKECCPGLVNLMMALSSSESFRALSSSESFRALSSSESFRKAFYITLMAPYFPHVPPPSISSGPGFKKR